MRSIFRPKCFYMIISLVEAKKIETENDLKISLLLSIYPNSNDMARTQSQVKTSSPAPVATTPAPVAETPKPKVVKAAKAKAEPVVVEQAPAPVVVEQPAAPAEGSSTESREDRHKAALAAVDAQLTALKQLRSTLVANFKSDSADLKAAQKAGGRRRRAAPVDGEAKAKRAPSGITKPTKVSDQMCEFLGLPKGSEVARTQVTKAITSYIKEHNLKDPNTARKILPDAKLTSLLGLKPGDELTFFNLQTKMTSHFPKAQPQA